MNYCSALVPVALRLRVKQELLLPQGPLDCLAVHVKRRVFTEEQLWSNIPDYQRLQYQRVPKTSVRSWTTVKVKVLSLFHTVQQKHKKIQFGRLGFCGKRLTFVLSHSHFVYHQI